MRLFVDQLTVMDFSLLHPDRGLVGESWRVDVELEGVLDEQGMVLDFGDVKRQVKWLIDERFDHRLLVPADHPQLNVQGEELRFFTTKGEFIRHCGPAEAVQFIAGDQVTPDNAVRAIAAMLKPLLPSNVQAVRLRLYPETIDTAWYRYSHGLKGHCGNCQRIAHGHRSRIEISRNGVREPSLENRWAERFQDIYIGNEADMVAIIQHNDQSCFRFAYEAEQGAFELELPASRCYLIDSESTVENIARHIREQLEREYPADQFLVRAFEGIGKGAISSSGDNY